MIPNDIQNIILNDVFEFTSFPIIWKNLIDKQIHSLMSRNHVIFNNRLYHISKTYKKSHNKVVINYNNMQLLTQKIKFISYIPEYVLCYLKSNIQNMHFL